MEESKKEIKLGTSKVEEKKLSYEQVTEIANQLHTQNQKMIARIRELEFTLNQVRLEYLFAVVNNSEKFPAEFAEMCVKEIVRVLSPAEQVEEPDSKEEK